MSDVAVKCHGCGGSGAASTRLYMARDRRNNPIQRSAIDAPSGWGNRYDGRERLYFCPTCSDDLATGKRRLKDMGAAARTDRPVLGHAEKEVS